MDVNSRAVAKKRTLVLLDPAKITLAELFGVQWQVGKQTLLRRC